MFNTYFLDVIKNHYIDFAGKATRKQFWLWVLWVFIIFVVLSLVLGLLGLAQAGKAILWLCWLGLLLPALGIAARRLRDGGFSPWLLLLGLIPFIGGLVLLVLYLFPSKK